MHWKRTIKFWPKRGNREAGYSLPLAALGMTVLLGVCGVALDFGYFYSHRREMQLAADAGAMAGAHERKRGKDTHKINTAAQGSATANGFAHGQSGTTVTVNNPPASGFFAGDDRYVEVIIRQPTPALLLPVLRVHSVNITARAVSGMRPNPNPCILALNRTEEKTFMVHSTSYLTANCGIHSNSSAYNGYYVTSNGHVTSTSNSVTGGADVNSGSTATPTVRTGVARVMDPLSYLTPPAYGACNYNDYKVSSATVTLNPGVYCGGIEIGSGSTATFRPGLYVIKDKGLLVASGSTVSGTGVTIFNTGGHDYQPIKLESGSWATLAAPTTGTWANILFYQDPAAGKPGDIYYNQVASSSHSVFSGAMYFPTQRLNLADSSSVSTYNGIIVADMIWVASNSTTHVNATAATSPPTTISLME
jgi:hypothetical protein